MVISISQLKSELEKAIKNREVNADNFNSEFHKGELAGFKEVLRRINQFIDDKEKCSICQSSTLVMPKAGAGTVTHWICLKCVLEKDNEVLPEYLENIKEFGHWHRPLSGDIN